MRPVSKTPAAIVTSLFCRTVPGSAPSIARATTVSVYTAQKPRIDLVASGQSANRLVFNGWWIGRIGGDHSRSPGDRHPFAAMFAEAAGPPVEIAVRNGCRIRSLQWGKSDFGEERAFERAKEDRPPPAVFSADPDADLEEKLQRNPDDLDAKVDVGSDESMDASDPPSVVRPGSTRAGAVVPLAGRMRRDRSYRLITA